MQPYHEYEEEFLQILDHIRQKVSLLPSSVGERRKMLTDQAEQETEEAAKFLRKMEIAIRDLPQKTKLQTQLKAYEAELSKARRQLLLTLPATTVVSPAELQAEQRRKIEESNRTLSQTSGRLAHIEAVSRDTEHIGTCALEDLQHQHQQLDHAYNKLYDIDQKVDVAKSLLKQMWWRIIGDTMIQVIIIILLVISIVGVVFFKWILPFF
ncbi:vesicle transport through interaction with t-SNAREs 1 [Pelomyxa schiedti]|nr:vesicle transport through interaction with t-SNAREs 1 [Pelomyxa schiedti]